MATPSATLKIANQDSTQRIESSEQKISDEEAMQLLMEGIDRLDVSVPAPTVTRATEADEVIDSFNPATIIKAEQEELISKYKANPNIIRATSIPNRTGRFDNGMKLFLIPYQDEQLYQILSEEKLSIAVSGIHQELNVRLMAFPENERMSAIKLILQDKIEKMLGDGVLKAVTLQEAASQLHEPFPISQNSKPIPKNKELLAGLGVHEESDAYRLMLHDPYLIVEIQIATIGVCSRDSAVNAGSIQASSIIADRIADCMPDDMQNFEARMYDETQIELRKILDRDFAWGRFFLARRDLLVAQYQERPIEEISTPEPSIPESSMTGFSREKKLEEIALYKGNLQRLRAEIYGKFSFELLPLKFFPIQIISSESGYISIKDQRRFEELQKGLISMVSSGSPQISEAQSIAIEMMSLVQPLSKVDFERKVQAFSVLTLRAESVPGNEQILESIGMRKDDPLYETMLRDLNLYREIELADIGVCIKDEAISEALFAAWEMIEKIGQEVLIDPLNLQGLTQNMESKVGEAKREKLGVHLDRYHALLVETLKEQYKARLT